MDADFINAYIEQLNKGIHDLSSENVVLKTRLAVAEKRTASLQEELHETKITLEKLQNKKSKNVDEF